MKMKKQKVIYIVLFSIIFIFVSAECFGQEYYQKGNYRLIRSNPDVPLVAAVDVQALSRKYLSDFRVDNVRYSQKDDVIVYHLYQNNGIQQIIFSVGLHPSVRDAEEAMLDALNHQENVGMSEWPHDSEKIGESAWYYPNPRKSGYKDGVAFIRRNAVFWIYTCSEPEYLGVESLSRSIDRDLVNGAPFISIRNQISPPVVTSVNLSQTVFHEGERGTLTINGEDPEGRRIILYGNSMPYGYGGEHNQMPIYANSRDWIDEPFAGKHIIRCWVINEDNLFSSIKEVTVTF
jgi:hypothetical protein